MLCKGTKFQMITTFTSQVKDCQVHDGTEKAIRADRVTHYRVSIDSEGVHNSGAPQLLTLDISMIHN